MANKGPQERLGATDSDKRQRPPRRLTCSSAEVQNRPIQDRHSHKPHSAVILSRRSSMALAAALDCAEPRGKRPGLIIRQNVESEIHQLR